MSGYKLGGIERNGLRSASVTALVELT